MKRQLKVIPAEIKDYIDYNPDTGVFTWLKTTRPKPGTGGRGAPGSIAGCEGPQGYLVVAFRGVVYRAHRVAWWWVNGTQPPQIDHINRNIKDNRIVNLRAATAAGNTKNAGGKGARTGVKGVVKNGNRFYGRVHLNYKSHNAGSYGTLEEAKQAVEALREKLHREFACHE